MKKFTEEENLLLELVKATVEPKSRVLTEDELELLKKIIRGKMTTDEAIDYHSQMAKIKSNERP